VTEGTMIVSGQAPRAKVLKWPNREVVVGYVGKAEIAEGEFTDEWLYSFIGRNLDTDLSLRQLAENLKRDLERDLRGAVADEPMLLHLGGFVEEAGQWEPRVLFVRNARTLDALGNYTDIEADFLVTEELDTPGYFQGMSGNEIRADLDRRAQAWTPLWFHQGYDLGTFNMLELMLRRGMKAIVQNHPAQPHPFPDSLREWSKHLKMAILTYGAYFGAFHEPYQQYVGGGADVVWARWP
jgi:hypothetical protein